MGKFIEALCKAVDRRSLEANEEFILNAVSCITNILYYDTANDPIFTPECRSLVFSTVWKYLLANENEEI